MRFDKNSETISFFNSLYKLVEQPFLYDYFDDVFKLKIRTFLNNTDVYVMTFDKEETEIFNSCVKAIYKNPSRDASDFVRHYEYMLDNRIVAFH